MSEIDWRYQRAALRPEILNECMGNKEKEAHSEKADIAVISNV